MNEPRQQVHPRHDDSPQRQHDAASAPHSPGRCRGRRKQPHDRKPTVGAPAIAAPVATLELGLESRDPLDATRPVRADDLLRKTIALGVHVLADVMRHLAGGIAQPGALVVGDGPEPHRQAVAFFAPAPESDVVAMLGTARHRLLEGQVLHASEQEQRADGRRVVGTPQRCVHRDADARLERDRIGGEPACGEHRLHDIVLAALQCDVDRIAGMPVGRVRDAFYVRQGLRVLEVVRPQPGREQISHDGP